MKISTPYVVFFYYLTHLYKHSGQTNTSYAPLEMFLPKPFWNTSNHEANLETKIHISNEIVSLDKD